MRYAFCCVCTQLATEHGRWCRGTFHNNGNYNTAVGWGALFSNTTGNYNTAMGDAALRNSTNSEGNSAFGDGTLLSTTSALNNSAFGRSAARSNTTGSYNVAMGAFALYNNVTGSGNVAIGADAGYDIIGSGNICIGTNVLGFSGDNNVTRIGNVSTTPISSNFLTVVVENGDTRVGYASSSRRYKKDIEPIATSSKNAVSTQTSRLSRQRG
jgi:trimeric autotransporter adhesin